MAKELIFFTHPATLESFVFEDMARDIYLKKIRYWRDGKKIRPLDHSVGSSEKNNFNKAILEKTETALTQYWIQEKQSSGIVQPLQVQNLDMMIYLVETMEGSVGYLIKSPENLRRLEFSKVKVLQYE